MESKFTAYLLHKLLEQTDTNLVFPVSIRMRPSKKAYKTSIFETYLVNSYRIMFDSSCLLSGRSRVRIAPGVPISILRTESAFLIYKKTADLTLSAVRGTESRFSKNFGMMRFRCAGQADNAIG